MIRARLIGVLRSVERKSSEPGSETYRLASRSCRRSGSTATFAHELGKSDRTRQFNRLEVIENPCSRRRRLVNEHDDLSWAYGDLIWELDEVILADLDPQGERVLHLS